MAWTRITTSEDANNSLPAWLGRGIIGLHGRFGLLLTTGDVLRITTITAVHHSSDGIIMLDVVLDSAGVPPGIDLAWRPKQFLGAPVAGATSATVNIAQVVTAVDFLGALALEAPKIDALPITAPLVVELLQVPDPINDSEMAMEHETPTGVGGALARPDDEELAVRTIDLPAPDGRRKDRKKKRK